LELLLDITVIFAVSVGAVLVCHRLRIPSTVGFLLAGVLAGPDALRLVRVTEQVELLADIGVVLLLFVIGLEFSLGSLHEMRKQLLLGGTVQMYGTATVIGVGTYLMGSGVAQSAYIGFVVALSSTAIVLKLLQERAELDSPHGRMVLGTLIYQDIAVVPLILAAPLLAGGSGAGSSREIALLLARIIGIGAVAFASYRWAVPWLLYQIARTRSREAFLLGVLGICAGIALLTQQAGLSLALGAFLAGLIISESEYSHQAVGVILPFRDAFISLFFVSIGMLLDIHYLLSHPLRLALLTLGILLIKPAVGAIAAISVGLPIRNAALAGMSLGQIGEFSLVATTAAVTAGLLSAEAFQTVLDTAVLSMLVAPAMIAAGPALARALQAVPFAARLHQGFGATRVTSTQPCEGHVIIVGFGVTGRNIARSAREAGVEYAAIEMNAEVVRAERARGEPIYYGDATHEAILRHLNAGKARAVVVVINDPAAARRIVELARRIAPDAYIVVRSRYLKEAEALYGLGADEVIADELEVSIEIFSRVLARCLVPREDIERFIDDTRAEWREMARSLSPEATAVHDLRVEVPDLSTRSFRLTERSPLVGRTIAQSGLRSEHGVTVLAVRRAGGTLGNPVGATTLLAGDVLFVIGPHDWDPGPIA
jgi:CPA2 family monovalent cation:H+ antiporter-2